MAKTEPQQIGFADSAPFQVSYTQELPPIPTPVDAVFEVFKDNRGGVKWLGWFVTSVEPTSDPELVSDLPERSRFCMGWAS